MVRLHSGGEAGDAKGGFYSCDGFDGEVLCTGEDFTQVLLGDAELSG